MTDTYKLASAKSELIVHHISYYHNIKIVDCK